MWATLLTSITVPSIVASSSAAAALNSQVSCCNSAPKSGRWVVPSGMDNSRDARELV